MIKNFFNEQQIVYYENISLKKYNAYRVDTTCDFLVYPKSTQELITILQELKHQNIKYLILGNGSNVIFANKHFNGVIIKLDNLNEVKYENNLVTVGAGYPLIKLAIETIERGLSGLEFATCIPGCVGASTAMNAGAYNSSMSEVVDKVEVINDKYEVISLTNEEMLYTYRDSLIKQNKDYIVISTTFKLAKGNTEEMKKIAAERKQKRILSQPLDKPNAGSVFRNPENMYAGELIEKSNLKGKKINDAEVSTKHANFIINNGNSSGKDIIGLINLIKKEVKKNYNVELQLEQIIIE